MNEERPLIEVRVKSIKQEPYIAPHGGMAQSALIIGRSDSKDASFEFQTGLLNPEQVRRCEFLQQHGFTAVQAPENWRYGYNGKPGGWQHDVVISAMDRIAAIYANKEGVPKMGYNEDLAREVLVVLDKTYPNPVHAHQVKHELKEEPSDTELLIALDALYLEGSIQGKPLRESSAGGSSRLVQLANIQITAKGHRQLQAQTETVAVPSAVVHGDQIINYGNAGAIGRHSVGTFNQQQQWAAIANQVDLSQLVDELRTLKAELMKTATTPTDFQQLVVIAEAEQCAAKKDGPKVMEVLAKSGKWLFDFATGVGTDVAAKLIAKATGLEP